MSFEVVDDKISGSSLAAGSDVITLPRKAVKRILVGVEYTVTDAAISAGENIRGWIDDLQIIGGNKVILKVGRDELASAVAALAAYGTDSMSDEDVLNIMNAAALYSDDTPTTAQLQRAWFMLNLPHDFRIYESAEMRVSWRAATDEWGGASALTYKLFVVVQTGNVPRSLGLDRVASASSTIHDLPMGDYPVIGGLLVPGTANYISEVKVKGKDGKYEVVYNEGIPGQAVYNMMTGTTPADDDADYQMLPPVLIPWYGERRLNVTCSTATTLTALLVTQHAAARLTSGANKGDAYRGVAAAQITKFDSAATARAITSQRPPTLMRRVI